MSEYIDQQFMAPHPPYHIKVFTCVCVGGCLASLPQSVYLQCVLSRLSLGDRRMGICLELSEQLNKDDDNTPHTHNTLLFRCALKVAR